MKIQTKRTTVEIKYSTEVVKGFSIDVEAVDVADISDISTRRGLVNDGLFNWTLPNDFKGSVEFTVKGSKGGTVRHTFDF